MNRQTDCEAPHLGHEKKNLRKEFCPKQPNLLLM